MKTHPVAGSVPSFPVRVSREQHSVIQMAKPRASLKLTAVRTVLSEARGVTASRGDLSPPGHYRARTTLATARCRAGGREKADDSLPDREVPLAAEGVRSGPNPRRWCLTPNGHGPKLNPSRFSLPLTTLTAHGKPPRGWLGTFFSRAGVAKTAQRYTNGKTSGLAEDDGRTNGAQRGSRRDSAPRRFIPPRCRGNAVCPCILRCR